MWVWIPEGRDGLIPQIRRASVEKIDDGGSQQIFTTVRGLASEQFEDVHRPQSHGFSSHPPSGSEGILLAMSGRSDRALAIGFEHRDHRHKGLKAGESVLYDDKGNFVHMRGAAGVTVKAKDGDVIVYPDKSEKKVYLGGDPAKGHQFAKVVTESGPSINVYARIE